MRKGIAVTSVALIVALPFSAPATIPVVDYSAITQAITGYLKQVQQYAQQVQAYQLQLQQYANEVKQATGLADIAKVYQQYTQTMQSLSQLYGQFANGGSLQNYLNQFQNVQYWEQVPPGNYAQAANQSWDQNSQTQKQLNDTWAQSLAQHQQLLAQDAANLQRAQGSAQGADGMLAAIQANSQLLAAVAKQLMEIQALLVQEQQGLQARQASQANQDAMGKALNDRIMGVGTTYTAQEGKVWIP